MNSDENTLNCVLGVLVVVVICLFVWKIAMNKCRKNEFMHEQNKVTDEINLNAQLDDQYINTKHVGHRVDDADLIKDVVINGKREFATHEFDKLNTKQYHDEHLNFLNKINNSSTNTCDPVDRINEIYTQTSNEFINNTGKTISHVYDDLTKSQMEDYKKCKHDGCIVPPNFDKLSQRNYHIKNNTFTDYVNVYEFDDVNNGGKFYNNIEGDDKMTMNNLAFY